MKKLILFISLFIFGNSFGQTITVTNNTGSTLEFNNYTEWDDPGCQSTVTYNNVSIPTGTNTIASLTSGTLFITALLRDPITTIVANTSFLSPYSCLPGGQTTATIVVGGILRTATWSENSSTHDVTILIN
jgi:hypothetical protein